MYLYVFIYNNNKYNNRDPDAAGGRQKWFQQLLPTHSGAGEKETLNVNVVGKMKTKVVQERKTVLNELMNA